MTLEKGMTIYVPSESDVSIYRVTRCTDHYAICTARGEARPNSVTFQRQPYGTGGYPKKWEGYTSYERRMAYLDPLEALEKHKALRMKHTIPYEIKKWLDRQDATPEKVAQIAELCGIPLTRVEIVVTPVRRECKEKLP